MPVNNRLLLRPARAADATALVPLCDQLGYPGSADFIAERLISLVGRPDHRITVAADLDSVLGFAHLRLVQRLIRRRPVALLDALCIDAGVRGSGLGARLLADAETQARGWGCDRIELHSHHRRHGAHRFYEAQDYTDEPRYFIKLLDAGSQLR